MAGMERFTQRARHVLALAHEEAESLHQNKIYTEHLLLGLIEEEGGVAGRALRDLGLEPDRFLLQLWQPIFGVVMRFGCKKVRYCRPFVLQLPFPVY